MNKILIFGIIAIIALASYSAYAGKLIDDPIRAMYGDSGYTWQQRSDADVTQFVEKHFNPDIMVLHTAKMNPDGTIKEHAVGNFLQRAKELKGTKTYLAVAVWTRYRDNSPNYVDISDPVKRETLKQAIKEHVERYDADGLVLDFEPIASGDETYLAFVGEVNEMLDVPVVVYGFRIRNTLDNNFVWDEEYWEKMATKADYMFLAMYNVREYFGYDGIEYNADTYRKWTLEQYKAVERMGLLEKTYFGLPGFEDTFNSDGVLTHGRAVENIENVHPLITNANTMVFSGHKMTEQEFVMYYDFLQKEKKKGITQLIEEVLGSI